MRKRIFFPIFIFLISFPLLIFLLSYTRFFNEELRRTLISVVNDQTNARLYLGEIHGSVLGSFRIDGAALYYQNAPIAMVDTVEISHLPLSLIAKTIEVINVKLVNPRFYLTRYRDGTYNVDRISKATSKPGGKFDWTVLLKSVRIHGGEFSLYDSTSAGKDISAQLPPKSFGSQRFDASDFSLKNIELNASATLSGDNLTASVKNISLSMHRPSVDIDSLRFDFYTSQGGTEVSGFRLMTNSALIHADVTLIGQDLLDSLNMEYLRQKQLSVSLDARDVDLRQVEDFIDIPIDPVSRFDLSLFASGSLDTLNLKQFLLRTDSSYLPIAATFHNVVDRSMTMRISVGGGRLNMAETSSLLNGIGFPNVSELETMQLDATADGRPQDLNVGLQLRNSETEVSGDAHIYGSSYDGQIFFHGIDAGKILEGHNLKSRLNGVANFSLRTAGGAVPDGKISLSIDSSSYDHTSIQRALINASSVSDSVDIALNLLTSKGNIDGETSINVARKSYSCDLAFTEFDVAPFLHLPTLEGNFTGRLKLAGSGFGIDSLRTQLSIFTERASLGDFPLDNSAFTVELNTQQKQKNLRVYSPFLDADASGDFVPHELPTQLSTIFSAIADSLRSRVTGKRDSVRIAFSGIANLNASLNVKVKDAKFLGRLIGDTELFGHSEAHLTLASDAGQFSMSGSVSADTLGLARDSLRLNASKLNAQFSFNSDSKLSVWNSGRWSVDASFNSLDINQTRLRAKVLRVNYIPSDSSHQDSLSVSALGEVDTLLQFYVDAYANLRNDSLHILASTLLGRLYGVSLTSQAPVHVIYSPEAFLISPATFYAGFNNGSNGTKSRVLVQGTYSLERGADLYFKFHDCGLRSLQQLARLDTNSLKLNGRINGDADLVDSDSGTVVSINFTGNDVDYNGAESKSVTGRVSVDRTDIALLVQLSNENDSTRYALRLDGTIPLSGNSSRNLSLDLAADSLDVSFLTPLLTGVQDFGGVVSGNMGVSGKYASPELRGNVSVTDGRIRLAANEINYLFNGTIVGKGDKLVLSPLVIRNVPGQAGGTMEADGWLGIGSNTIEEFNVGLKGSLLALNSSARRSLHGIYGTAIVGAGQQGLRLKGSLTRPMLEGTVNIQNADLTLLPLQKKESLGVQEIIYRFPNDAASRKPSQKEDTVARPAPLPAPASGSLIDSLRYDVEVETKDNMNLRMIFDPTTNEELNAVLGGRLHLSNLSGSMELTGDVNVLNNSYYNFYRQFAATGKLRFTGNPLNPTLDINAQYQGDHYADTSTSKAPQVVVVQLNVTGTFDVPSVNISMTVDNNAYQGDPQTNAISFILTGQFEDELTSSQKRSIADNLWSQAGAGILTAGSSILSGIATSFLSREFSFIRSAELRYSSISGLSNPDVAITTQIGSATIKVGGQVGEVLSDINNTDVSVDYPLADILGNQLYLQLSRKVAISNRSYFQRETINMLRLFYQLSF